MARTDSQIPLPDSLSSDSDAIESWLSVFARLMRLPDSRKQAICAELHEHLRERVRDLMLAGHSEPQSIQQAIGELGETAQLAHQFESANRTKQRRLFMNLSIIGVSAGALAVGIIATQSHKSPASVFESATPNQVAVNKDAKLNVENGATLRMVIESITEQTSHGVSIDWDALEPLGFSKDVPVGLTGQDLPVQRVLEILSERSGPSGERLDWRFDGRTVFINTSRYFDTKESILACYDIREVVVATTEAAGVTHDEAVTQIRQVLQNLVEPDGWRDNGGDIAAMHIVADRMFVQAPPRMHKRIEWILQQLNEGADVGGGGEQSKAEQVPLLRELPLIDPIQKPKVSAVPPSILGPGDAINVEILDLITPGEWYKATRTVDAEGNVRLPVVGDISVGGHRPKDVEVNLVDKLKDRGILANPIVSVYPNMGTISNAVSSTWLGAPDSAK